MLVFDCNHQGLEKGMFEIPSGAQLYIDRILDRCDRLISSGIWTGINRQEFYLWFRSYSSSGEKYFAALMLDGLTVRSQEQTKSLMLQGFQRVLPELLQDIPYFDRYRGKWLETLRKSNVPIRMVPVLEDGDGPHKSGPVICREYNRLQSINSGLMIYPTAIEAAKKDGVKLFIFVDDFVGTGEQFSGFYKGVEKYFSDDTTSCYLPLCAHQNGIKEITDNNKGLRVSAPEILTEKDSFFGEDDELLPDQVNTYASLKEFYLELLEKRLGEVIPEPFGYGGLSLLYGFNHATPNATLPILWSSKNDNTVLLKRG